MNNPSKVPAAVAIVGVSGYSGMELARLVAGHPSLALVGAISDKWAGDELGARLPLARPFASLKIRPQEEATAAAKEADLVFLCTPAEASLMLAPALLEAGTRVVDLSGAFRLAVNEYPRWYGFEHPHPDLLAAACYSMPEAGASAELREARLVSNPGCYATAGALPVLALLRAGVIERQGIILDGKSGTTGGGRRGGEDWSFSEVDGDVRAYRVLRHQHTPEIERALQLGEQGRLKITFTPHLLPTRRGILMTVYGRLAAGAGPAEVAGAMDRFAAGRPFLRAVKPEAVRLQAVLGTNRVLLAGDADVERGVAVGLAAIDNLVKGAAGQALQNANLMLGFPERTGLDGLPGSAP